MVYVAQNYGVNNIAQKIKHTQFSAMEKRKCIDLMERNKYRMVGFEKWSYGKAFTAGC